MSLFIENSLLCYTDGYWFEASARERTKIFRRVPPRPHACDDEIHSDQKEPHGLQWTKMRCRQDRRAQEKCWNQQFPK